VVATSGALSVARDGGRVVRESVIEVGDEVTVVGLVRRDLDPMGQSSYREPPTRLVLGGPVWIIATPTGRR
jgi:hypothetical protein